jgi:hypothetical protein
MKGVGGDRIRQNGDVMGFLGGDVHFFFSFCSCCSALLIILSLKTVVMFLSAHPEHPNAPLLFNGRAQNRDVPYLAPCRRAGGGAEDCCVRSTVQTLTLSTTVVAAASSWTMIVPEGVF